MISAGVALVAMLSTTSAMANGYSYGYSSSPGSVYVQPHIRDNGSYVQGHYRTRPDSTRSNNWSSKGNVNPYTGKRGTLRYRY